MKSANIVTATVEIDDTEVEVRFEEIEGGTSTRVTLEHRGWEKVFRDIADLKRGIKRAGAGPTSSAGSRNGRSEGLPGG